MKLKHMASIAILVLASLLTQAQAWSQDKTLKVGSTPTGVPFTFLDTKTNSIQGVMVDLITEIGKDAGFQVHVPWPGRLRLWPRRRW